MRQTRHLLLVLATLACAGTASAVEIAQPDEALVRRYEQHPDEWAARVRECDEMSVAAAVGSIVCVSTKEARYRRERTALRMSAPATPAPNNRAATATVQTVSFVSKPAPTVVAAAAETR